MGLVAHHVEPERTGAGVRHRAAFGGGVCGVGKGFRGGAAFEGEAG
jgi:hypothetical protein